MTASTDRLTTALEGRYRIERELGRKVAIKVLKPELATAQGLSF